MMTVNMSRELWFVGDPHGRYQHIVDGMKAKQPKATILLGDLCYDQPIEQLYANIPAQSALHWIHGNHDTDHTLWHDHLFHSAWADKSIHAQVMPFAGLTVAGLGGVFRHKVWNPQHEPTYATRASWEEVHSHKRFAHTYARAKEKHASTIWHEDYQYLAQMQADILVLHEAPTSDRHGYQALDDLAAMLGARLILHGHHHRFYTATLSNGIAVVGLGLAQIACMDMDAFLTAKDNESIFSAFTFGEVSPEI